MVKRISQHSTDFPGLIILIGISILLAGPVTHNDKTQLRDRRSNLTTLAAVYPAHNEPGSRTSQPAKKLSGSTMTEAITFAAFTDTHVGVQVEHQGRGMAEHLDSLAKDIMNNTVPCDFVVHLGLGCKENDR